MEPPVCRGAWWWWAAGGQRTGSGQAGRQGCVMVWKKDDALGLNLVSGMEHRWLNQV